MLVITNTLSSRFSSNSFSRIRYSAYSFNMLKNVFSFVTLKQSLVQASFPRFGVAKVQAFFHLPNFFSLFFLTILNS